MTAATISLPDVRPRASHPEWTPSDRERLVFQWVKFEGRTQGWVAEQLSIHQSTVSRMVERYEKWIAHGGPGRRGGLDHDERLRAQRWLTYERNEWILSAALRIAAEIEQPCDATKSTISRSAASPSQETEIRTQHMTVDRSGTVARYLRLAHRVNMENLKLVEEEPLPALKPLTFEDLAEREEEQLPRIVAEPEAIVADGNVGTGAGDATDSIAADATVPVANRPVQLKEDLPVMQPTHNEIQAESLPNADTTNTCSENCPAGNPATTAYGVADYQPEMGGSLLAVGRGGMGWEPGG
jgi:hypothetical protein